MKILIVNCLCIAGNRTRNPKLENLGIGYLAAVLRREGYNVEILDANIEQLEVRETVDLIMRFRPQILGFSLLRNNFHRTMAVIECLRTKGTGCHIVLGGYLATFLYKEILRDFGGVDSIVRGEGEYTLLELAEKLQHGEDWRQVKGIAFRENGEVRMTMPRPLIQDLDSLPFPVRDTLPSLFRQGNHVASISPSRGCYMNCSFCNIKSFYGLAGISNWRPRDPEKIVDEMETLLESDVFERYDADYFWFCVDEFVGLKREGKSHAQSIAEEILRRNLHVRFEADCRADRVTEDLFSLLKEAGLRRVYLGIESFVQKMLNKFNKGTSVDKNKKAIEVLEKLGIDYSIGIIMFSPDSTLEEFQENHSVIKEIGYRKLTVPLSRLKLFRGTKIESEIRTNQKASLAETVVDRIADLTNPNALDYIYDYEFNDPRIKDLWDILCDCDSRNEKIVDTAIELFDRQIIDSITFWRLVYLVRDSIADFISEAIELVMECCGDNKAIQNMREEHGRKFERSYNELAHFKQYLQSEKGVDYTLWLNGKEMFYDKEKARLPYLRGLDWEIAEREYRLLCKKGIPSSRVW